MRRSRQSTPWNKLAFDLPVPARSCEPCTACCTWRAAPLGPKPLQDACGQVCASGCAIHGDRPPDCRFFECAWLSHAVGLRDEDRPDLLGVIVEEHKLPPDHCIPGAETVYEVWLRAPEVLQNVRVRQVLEDLAQFSPVVARGRGFARVLSMPTKPLVTPDLARWVREHIARLDVGVLR